MSWWTLRTSNSRWTRQTLNPWIIRCYWDILRHLSTHYYCYDFLLLLLQVLHFAQEAPAETEIFHEDAQTRAAEKISANVMFIPLVPLCLLLENPSHQVDLVLLSLPVGPDGTATQTSPPCSSSSLVKKRKSTKEHLSNNTLFLKRWCYLWPLGSLDSLLPWFSL